MGKTSEVRNLPTSVSDNVNQTVPENTITALALHSQNVILTATSLTKRYVTAMMIEHV